MDQLAGHGDPTTTGGRIVGASSTTYENTKRMSLSGDAATCGNCTGGPFPIFGTANTWTENGKAMVKHLDRVLCPCGKNHVIADSTLLYGGGSATQVRESSVVNKVANVTVRAKSPFDEQVSVVADSVHHFSGLPYVIETADGQITDGVVPRDGRLPRVFTDAEAAYTVYWGDEALARRHA